LSTVQDSEAQAEARAAQAEARAAQAEARAAQTLGSVVGGDGAEEHHDRLARATSRLRGVRDMTPERWFQLAGWVLPPLGVALIALGWYGAANTSRVWQQIPYVASGGLLGIALVTAGGFSCAASWLTRLVDQARIHAEDAAAAQERAAAAEERTAAALERIEALLGGGARGGRGRRTATGSAGLVATATGSMAHRPDCPMVAGRDNLRRVAPDEPGLRPCLVCQPTLATAGDGTQNRR